MADSRSDAAAEPAIMSRRQAIVGALALAAGALVAARPQTALAQNGDPVTAGGSVYAAGGTTLYLNTGGTAAGTELAQAMINRNGTGGSPIQAFGGVVMPAAPAASAGVWGFAWNAAHYGVHAAHGVSGGTALKVEGKVELSRSGRHYMSKGQSSHTVPVPSGIATTAMIFVTLQDSAGTGVYVRYAQRMSATTFKVVLNKACTSSATFAWMIIG